MKTVHINCDDNNLIAKTVLMPGDPLRAKFLADNFLTDVVMFNNVRNCLGYTGYYKGKRISVMSSGMGIASIGIYSYELFNFFGVENIIRIGSAGAYSKDLNLYDVCLVTSSYSESTYPSVAFDNQDTIINSSSELNEYFINQASKLNMDLKQIRVHSSDVFYNSDQTYFKKVRDSFNCSAVEMESFGLFANAINAKKKATCLLTISDSLVTNEKTSSFEREQKFTKMMELALQIAE